MINILLTGVGGQGTVLAAKVLAVAAASKGWQVRSAETIGMAQRGGSVVSHVRIGNNGEEVHAPLITHGTANLVIAFEPGEAARVLPYLSRQGLLVTATTPIQPVTSSLGSDAYNAHDIIEGIHLSLYNSMAKSITRGRTAKQASLFPVNDAMIIRRLGGNRKVLNTIMLAVALAQERIPITVEDLRHAIAECVKEKFVPMNLRAIDAALEGTKYHAHEA